MFRLQRQLALMTSIALAGWLLPVQAPAKEPANAQATPASSPEDRVKARLNDTAWEVTLNPMSDPTKTKPPIHDTLRFAQGQVSSQRFTAQGFPATRYTVTIGGDGTATWETMQTSEKQGVVFWRSELQGNDLHGVFSHRPLEGDPEDYSFNGRETAHQPPAVAPAPEPAPTPPAAVTNPVPVVSEPAPVQAAPPTGAQQPAKKKPFKLW